MPLTIREIRPDDARDFLDVHHAAVRGLAAKDYSADVIEAWAHPVSGYALEHFQINPDNEFRLIAEIGGQAVGIGSVVIRNSELRACYVTPGASRNGVGTAIVQALESVAWAHGAAFLELDSSLNAEPFYAALGYEVVERGRHVLGMGPIMACVKMHKDLRAL